MKNRERFKKNIRIFEFEPHSYCNRKCWFCPNKFIDRTGPVKFLDEKIYAQILKDLASINYSEGLFFAGWCEPFSQPNFLDFVKQARGYLPNAMFQANSNTDYLTTEVIQKVAENGLDVLKAQLYFGEDEKYTEVAIRRKMDNLKVKFAGIHFEEKTKVEWFALVGDLVVHAYSKDFRKQGKNRCDIRLREPVRRYHTCTEAITMVGVNHNGWVVPCCNIRSDYPPHKDVLLGEMNDRPGRIFELYQGVLLPETRYPCSTCMGKHWHPNHKMVYGEILKELKNGKRLLQV